MDRGQILMTNPNYDKLDTTGNNFYQQQQHHSHPELEHLANTMPVPVINYQDNNESNIRSQSRMSISHDKGLLNMPGQNNCFLNSAVQVLWHLDIFRRSFRELHGHACMGDSCIFCALKELFNQFQSSTESALPPDSLRFALAQAFSDQRRFRLGYMDDAAECFENILFRIHYHITNQELDSSSKCLPHCIPHQKFSMNLYEQIVCYSCGATSEPFIFSQMVHYTSTSALCTTAQIRNSTMTTNVDNDKAKFGDLLKKASSMGDIRNCPKMCGARMNIKKLLLNRPDIISIGLVWDTDHPSLSFIRNVYQLIETSIHLNEIFDLNDNGTTNLATAVDLKKFDLVGLVTYYGKHYSTYIFNTKLSQWIYFDDATVRVVGPRWQQVVEKCIKGHFQPLLLLYSNPKASNINTQYASKDIVPMTVIKKPEHHHDKIASSNLDVNLHQHQQLPYIQSEVVNDNKLDAPYEYKPFRQYNDLPDSPSATSTTSYFSDIGDSTDGYISRKTVENIIKIQQRSSEKQTNNDSNMKMLNYNRKYNRNSSSSLESFDSVVRQTNISKLTTQNNKNNNTTCSLQRRDSGNSSGDRASSASSIETPYYPQRRLLKMSHRNPSSKNVSDQGYDSFSLSSSDSYPSTTTSPSKLNSRLKQIPEDVQLIDMVNNLSMNECDKLCSEADILLLKSHEKEREGDLRAAAALSDSAAAKARLAMDIPYSNHQTLISAKMKHSMCVMRSTSLHKRVLELEVEEKRLMKAAMEATSHHHSRQSSRDSTHGRHSRQGSRDGKDPKLSKQQETKVQQASDTSKTTKDSRLGNWSSSFNLEIYATLPKKVKRKSQNKDLVNDCKMADIKSVAKTNEQKIYENLVISSQHPQKLNKAKNKTLVSDSDFSDYYSEWEATRKRRLQNKTDTINVTNGWQSCRENDSEGYAEFGGLPPTTKSLNKKQCKVKRKLMFGNFLKTKNRSLPDLREEVMKDNNKETSNVKQRPNDGTLNKVRSSTTTVAQINAKGFHQSHKSFVAEQGFKTKPLLIKVKPPLLDESSIVKKPLPSLPIIDQNTNDPLNTCSKTPLVVDYSQEESWESATKRNTFLEELNRKRSEIMKCKNDDYCKPIQVPIQNRLPGYHEEKNNQKIVKMIPPMMKKPSLFEIANFISKNTAISNSNNIQVHQHNQKLDLPVNNNIDHRSTTKLHMPIPVNPKNIDENYVGNGNKLKLQKPPDYETTLKRIEMNIQDMKKHSNMHPASSAIYSNVINVNHVSSNKLAINSSVLDVTNVDNSQTPIPSQNTSASFIHYHNHHYYQHQVTNKIQPNSHLPPPSVQQTYHRHKKTVKFSDQIELVACADDDDQEEPLPNLLLEKVLGKTNLIYTMQQ